MPGPSIVNAQALSPRLVRIAFDQDIVAQGVPNFECQALEQPAVPLRAVAAQIAGPLLDLTLDTEMTPRVRYLLIVSDLVDGNGHPTEPPGNRVEWTGFRPQQPGSRRFDLWSMLSKHNRRSDTTGDLRRFIACLQEVLDLLLSEIDRFPDIFDIERARAPFLDLILQDLGNPFPFELDDLGKRRLAAVLVEMYRQKGTAIGIKNAIRFFLGIDITAITPFTATTLILGESELGVDWELGPSSRFARYAFNVKVAMPLTDVQRRQLRNIVEYLKPAHTHFVDLIEPVPPPTFEHWELGISELGTNSDLHG